MKELWDDFKDHLVTWLGQYLEAELGKTQADIILDEIDRRCVQSLYWDHLLWSIDLIRLYSISLAPPFPNLRRFPVGRNFKQWTGDDSKALMKVCT